MDMIYVKLETTLGDIILELDKEKSPNTVDNFVKYVEDEYYNNTIFHRVIAGFMIQGGGFLKDMSMVDTREPIANEAQNGLENKKYTIAMARTQDPHSATGQFFINVQDNVALNFTAENVMGWGYAVFGRVVEGQEVVEAIENVETTTRSYHDDVPEETVAIKKATVLTDYTPK